MLYFWKRVLIRTHTPPLISFLYTNITFTIVYMADFPITERLLPKEFLLFAFIPSAHDVQISLIRAQWWSWLGFLDSCPRNLISTFEYEPFLLPIFISCAKTSECCWKATRAEFSSIRAPWLCI